ncbi:MAG: VanZ family protein, partial [Clostridia bacterium]|nr:VanZ family protein [Clostridia bacterium]
RIFADFLPILIRQLAVALPLLLAGLLLLHFLLFRAWNKTARYALFALYLAVLWGVAGLPDVRSANFAPNVNLIPFVGMAEAPLDTVLNVLLFLPLGLMLPLLWKRFRDGRLAVLYGFTLSLAVEAAQLFSGNTDIDDLLTNTLGTFLGYLIACALLLRYPALAKTDGTVWERSVLVILVILVMFFCAPLLGMLF